ncbi:MAG: hypothetical protein V1723_01360 [Candidatus Uhrbacteria bacterium]
MVIFLHGDDTYRSRTKLRELRERFLREVDPSGSNLIVINGETTVASEIWGAIAAQSFLVRKRLVIIEGIGEAKSAVRFEVAEFFDRIPEDAIVVFWEGQSRRQKIDGKHLKRPSPVRRVKRAKGSATGVDPFFPKLLAGKYVEEFVPLDGVLLERWVHDRAKQLDTQIAPEVVRALITEVGSDLWRMSNELEKLTMAAVRSQPSLDPRGGARGSDCKDIGVPRAEITIDAVRALVESAPSDDIFAFVDALGMGDRRVALCTLRQLEAAGTDPQYLVTMIARQARLLLSAADLRERGIPSAQVAVKLGVHPFVARKVIAQAERLSVSALRSLLLRVVELDARLKSSRASWEAIVELFLLDATVAR